LDFFFLSCEGFERISFSFVSRFAQITDVERECDGFYNYDRSNKFTRAQQDSIINANQALIHK